MILIAVSHNYRKYIKMKLFAVILMLPLGSLAASCYFCSDGVHTGATEPTYKCGKKCHKNNYDTTFPTYHCWKDGRNPTCFKNCCEADDKVVEVGSGW